MEGPQNNFETQPPEPLAVWVVPEDPERPRRRELLRRLRVLLVAGGLAFALITWMLVRVENPAALLGLGPGPASVARAHLDALSRGELRAAYDQFSAHYREQVSFEAFHRLVVTHRSMFRTEKVAFQTQEASGERAVLDGHMIAVDGERYLARFTMVRLDGRWWIDDIRWTLDEDDTDLIRT